MTGFKYTYLSTNEIFEKINYISIEIFPGIIYIFLIVSIIYLSNNFLFPAILFFIENYKKELNKKNRKNLLKQIILQKEIEEEIENSLK